MIYIGIDQSLSGFGFATYNPDEGYTVHLGTFPLKEYGGGVDRLDAIETWLMELLEFYEREGVRHICIEGYNRGARNGREEAGELGRVVKSAVRKTFPAPVCYPTIVPPTSVKKYATGNARAEKSLVLKAVYKKWGVDLDDDNLADAYTLARIAGALDDIKEATLAYEREVLSGLTKHTEQLRAA